MLLLMKEPETPSRISVASTLASLLSAVERLRLDVLEPLAAIYHEDITFEDPIQKVRGLGAFIEVNRRFITRARHVAMEVHELIEGERTFAMIWSMRFAPSWGPTLRIDGVSHAKVRDERILYQRDYWDLTTSLLSALPVVRDLYRRYAAKLA